MHQGVLEAGAAARNAGHLAAVPALLARGGSPPPLLMRCSSSWDMVGGARWCGVAAAARTRPPRALTGRAGAAPSFCSDCWPALQSASEWRAQAASRRTAQRPVQAPSAACLPLLPAAGCTPHQLRLRSAVRAGPPARQHSQRPSAARPSQPPGHHHPHVLAGMDRDKLAKMAGAVRTGGKGSVRRWVRGGSGTLACSMQRAGGELRAMHGAP